MREVLIVAKTRIDKETVCVGGLVLDDGTALRLCDRNGRYPSITTLYNVGDVWQLEWVQRPICKAPHLEDVVVTASHRLSRVEDPFTVISSVAEVWRGSAGLFDGRLKFSKVHRGAAYIGEGHPPSMSVGFWIAGRPLFLWKDGEALRYRQSNPAGVFTVKYVGVEPPLDRIPAGTMLRVSLARWLARGISSRCWLQLSGWFQPLPSC